MARDPRPDCTRVACEPQGHQARVAQSALDRGRQGSEPQPVPWPKKRGRRAVLGRGAVVAGAEHQGGEVVHVRRGEGAAAGEADLDPGPGPDMDSAQARGQGGRVVGDQEVAGVEVLGQPRPRRVVQAAIRPDHQQPGVRRALPGRRGGSHPASSSAR